MDAYRLTGTLTTDTSASAIFADPSGDDHVVELGGSLGKNFGKLVRVHPGDVVVLEENRYCEDWLMREYLFIPDGGPPSLREIQH